MKKVMVKCIYVVYEIDQTALLLMKFFVVIDQKVPPRNAQNNGISMKI